MAATILLPAGFVVLHAEGLLLAEADRAEAVGRNAQRNEILLDGVGAAVAEAEVVFGGTTLVAMAFDGDFYRGILLQVISGLRERRASVGTNVGLVVVEIGVAHFLAKIGLGLHFLRRWRRRIDCDGGRSAGGAARAGGRNRVRRRVRWRDLGRALSRDGANSWVDGELRGVRGIPAQSRRFT